LHPAVEAFDLGCGAGYLSMALADAVKSVTAIDISPKALSYLSQECQKRNINNLICRVADWHYWEPAQPADIVFLCYCNGLLSQFKKVSELTKEYLVVILPYDSKNNFHLDEYYPLPEKKGNLETVIMVMEFLEDKQIPFQLKYLVSEFGQPFSCKEEYEDFLNFYFQIPRHSIPAEYTQKYLQQREHGYYLANRKVSGMIIIKKGDFATAITGSEQQKQAG
jgi:SAM-dependent methyltransferase